MIKNNNEIIVSDTIKKNYLQCAIALKGFFFKKKVNAILDLIQPKIYWYEWNFITWNDSSEFFRHSKHTLHTTIDSITKKNYPILHAWTHKYTQLKKRKTNNENANFYHCFWYTYHKLLSHFEGEKIAIYVQLIKLLWHCNIYIGVLFVDDVFSFFQSFSLKQKPIKITPKSTAKSLLLYSFDEENKQTKIFVLLLCVCLYIYFYFALPCHECSGALSLMMTGSTLHFFLYRLHCAKRRKIDLY